MSSTHAVSEPLLTLPSFTYFHVNDCAVAGMEKVWRPLFTVPDHR